MSLAAAELSVAQDCGMRLRCFPHICVTLVVGGNLGLLVAAGHTSLMFSYGLEVATVGVIVSQLFLLALWLALGGQHWLARLVSVALPTSLLGRAVNFGLPDLSPAEAWVLIAGLCVTFVLCLHAMIVPLRWIGSLRLGFQPPAGCRQSGVRMQWRVRHLLLWTIWCAIPCALVRAVTPDHVVEILLAVALFGGFGLPLAVAMAFLVMSRRKLLSLAAAAAAWGIMTAVKQLIPDLFETPRMWEFNLAIVATVGGNLLLLRLGGLRAYRANEAPLTASDTAAIRSGPL